MLIWPCLIFLKCFYSCYFITCNLWNLQFVFAHADNMVLTYSKLVITELCRPFEVKSCITPSVTRSAFGRYVSCNFGSNRPLYHRHCADTSVGEVKDNCDAGRHIVAGIMIWASYVMFFLLILLSFLDFFFYNGLLFEWCRKKFKGLLGDSLDDDDMEDDKFSEFLKLEEEYRIPADQLQILTDNDSDPIYLGAGGFGSVYKATWAQDEGYPVAAKELNATKMEDPNERETFADEVKNLISANHRNVINFYGICEQTDYLEILMGFADGLL